MKKVMVIALLVVFGLVNVGCTDTQLTKLSQALNDVALSMGTLQTTVITANQQKLISDGDTETILRLCYKINAGGQEASKVTRALTKLTAPASSSVLAILQPILTAVNDSLTSGLVNIKDPTTKTNVYAALVAIQTALNTAQTILAATGGK